MKAFENMTPAERRVAIAKDVIQQLDAGSVVARSGLYIGREDGVCVACAIGCAFISAHRVRGLAAPDGSKAIWSGRMFDTLAAYFDGADLDEIENAFECDESWEEAYPNDDDRLRAIVRNIVSNDGTFVVEQVLP